MTQTPTLTFAEGPGVTAGATLRLGCSVTLLDAQGRVLLQKRTDGDWWCLPGGGVDAGETFRAAAVREATEETGLEVEVERLLGAYTDPTICSIYPDGNRIQIASLNFLCRIVGGQMITDNEETAELRWFAQADLPPNITPTHRQRLADVFHPPASLPVD